MNRVKILIFSLIAIVISISASADITFVGSSYQIFSETPAKSTGLDKIYVIYNVSGVTMSYTSKSSGNKVTWYKYGNRGGAYAEEITDINTDGLITTLHNITPNSGYIIEDGTDRQYIWVVNYADYYLYIKNLSFSSEDCSVAEINVEGDGADINYYTINGVPMVLSREINLEYTTLEWDLENLRYNEINMNNVLPGFKNIISTPAPLKNTIFTLSGDRFLEFWNLEEIVSSDTYTTAAVEVKAIAKQNKDGETSDNTESSDLGGSAPAVIEFSGYYTDAVIHKEWQIASDAEFENILYRFNEDNITYTFLEAGTSFVRFVGANSNGGCEATSDYFTVNIGESRLECPNAFSPQSSEGINDIWKVSYKSIVSFKCSIFNRWGIEMFNYSDPAQGWDGKYKGKYVDAGVYFYVIEAKGADGKKYSLKGDINIINYRK